MPVLVFGQLCKGQGAVSGAAAALRGTLMRSLALCRAGWAVPEHNMSAQHCRNLQESFPVTSLDPKMTGIHDDIVLWALRERGREMGRKSLDSTWFVF